MTVGSRPGGARIDWLDGVRACVAGERESGRISYPARVEIPRGAIYSRRPRKKLSTSACIMRETFGIVDAVKIARKAMTNSVAMAASS